MARDYAALGKASEAKQAADSLKVELDNQKADQTFVNLVIDDYFKKVSVDSSWELGTLTVGSGTNTPSNFRIRTTDYLYFNKGTHLKLPKDSIYSMRVYEYDSETKAFISTASGYKKEHTLDQVRYVKILIAIDDTTNMTTHLNSAPLKLNIYTEGLSGFIEKEIKKDNEFGLFELGTLVTSTGELFPSATRIRLKNSINIAENTVFKLKQDADEVMYALCFYDSDNNFIKWIDWRTNPYLSENSSHVKVLLKKKDDSNLEGLENVLPDYLTKFNYFKNSDTESYLQGNFDVFYKSLPVADVSEGNAFVLKNSTITDIYNKYDELMDGNSNFMSKKLLGYATGVDGAEDQNHPIYEYHIFNPMDNNNLIETPTILITTGVHGGEKSPVWSTYNFFEQMLKNWQQNETLESIRWNVNFKIVPIVNPYGYDINTRKNARNVDLNRNYDYKWGESGSTDEASWEYRGEGALSELETQTIHDWMEENSKAFAYIDFHNTMHTDVYTYFTSNSAKLEKIYSSLLRRLYGYWTKVYGIDISQQTREFLESYYYNVSTSSNNAEQVVGIKNSALMEIAQYDQNNGDKENTSTVIEKGVEMLANYILMLLKNCKY